MVIFTNLFIFGADSKNKTEQLKNTEKRKELFNKNGGEGYDYFVWGTSVDDVLSVYPDLQEVKSDNPNEPAELVRKFGRQNDTNEIMCYIFFNNKLCRGITIFRKLNESKLIAISTRLKELYGPATEKTEDPTQELITVNLAGKNFSYYEINADAYWKLSETFEIHLNNCAVQPKNKNYEDALTISMFITDSPVTATVDYYNKKMLDEAKKSIEEYNKKKEKDKIEEEKSKLSF